MPDTRIIALAFAVTTVLGTAPALAQDDDCAKANANDQAECYYAQADAFAADIVETVTEKCVKIENKPADQALCTAFGMAALLDEAKKWTAKKR